MKQNKITLVTSGVLLVIFLGMLFTFQVRQTEVAVVTTFGRYSHSVTNAGFQWRLPWPVQKVYWFDNRLQTFESKIDQPITQDQISLLISVYVGWHITDPKLFLESFNGDITKAEQTLEPIARNAKNGVIGLHRFGDLISTNQADLKFDQIEKEMFDAVQAQTKSNYGLAIESLPIFAFRADRRRQHLERVAARQPGMLGQIDLTHPACAQRPQDRVSGDHLAVR